MTVLSPVEKQAITARCEAATKGPWRNVCATLYAVEAENEKLRTAIVGAANALDTLARMLDNESMDRRAIALSMHQNAAEARAALVEEGR